MIFQNELKTFAAYSKNEKIRSSASSGGVFSHLALEIIKKNGVVFGASFDEKFNVIHTYVNNENKLCKFRGSKYVKSKTGNAYKKAKEFLDNGKPVYFSGTPCQIAGLKAYLQKDYENLFTQDIICHGAPDPNVWRKYIDFIQAEKNGTAKKVSFRDKSSGWRNYSTTIEFNDGKKYTEKACDNLYMKGFLRNLYLCKSCYNCKFKNDNFSSDITLGDFWGVENILPDFSDDKGIGLVIIRSKKGEKLFNDVRHELVYTEAESENAFKYNAALLHPAQQNKYYEQFYSEFNNGNITDKKFKKLMKKYCDDKFIVKLKKKVKRLFK